MELLYSKQMENITRTEKQRVNDTETYVYYYLMNNISITIIRGNRYNNLFG